MSKLGKVQKARTLDELAAACTLAASSIEQDISDIAAQTAQNLVFKLINVTPVDTTKALSNWQIGLMYPETDDLPAYAYGQGGLTAAMSRSTAFFVAQGVLAHKKPKARVYVSNNAPYIEELNEGRSKQADAGFVDRVILETNEEAQTALQAYLNGY